MTRRSRYSGGAHARNGTGRGSTRRCRLHGYQHVLVGLNAATGAVELHRYLDDPATANQPAYDQQRPALTIDRGRGCATLRRAGRRLRAYQGSVAGAPLTGDGPLVRRRVPTSREGAIWGTGGAVAGPQGDLWVPVGYSAAEGRGAAAIAQGLPHFSSLSPSGTAAYVSPLTGITAVSGA
jgi:hypothetical protein